MNPSRKVWVWIGSVAAALVLAAGIVVAGMAWNASSKQPVASAPMPVYAPEGELVPQFPKVLILDPAAAVSQSYSINYSPTTNQYTAEYDSSSSILSLYAAYLQYLPSNGWTITNQLTSYSNSRGVSATDASSSVEVSVVAQSGGSQVTIGYVTQ